MRLFLAVFPPPALQALVATRIESLRSASDGIAWVARDNLHYTLRFLGDLDEVGAGRAGDAAIAAAATQAAFDASLGAPGAFPNPRRARVLWLGLSAGAPQLIALSQALDAALALREFPRAERPFAPHLTIGRVREREQDWSAALAAVRPLDAPFRVDRLVLVHSQLTPRGAFYTRRLEAIFAPAAGPAAGG